MTRKELDALRIGDRVEIRNVMGAYENAKVTDFDEKNDECIALLVTDAGQGTWAYACDIVRKLSK